MAGCDQPVARRDHLRFFTLGIDNSAGEADTGADANPIELPPEALVYGLILSSDQGAVLKLQDSELEHFASECCPLDWDLPGVAWPASAYLVARAHSTVRLRIAYGQCRR